MKMSKGSLLMTVIVMFLFLCCKKDKGGDGYIPMDPVPTAHGTPLGNAVSKVIGPAGGSIESGDGRMSIVVPAGAVSVNTPFSVQPVTNMLKLGSGLSYRLLPENVNFNKDVEVSFKYDEQDLEGTSEDFLYLACQNAEGYWLRARNRTIDKTNKILKVNTKHFSDWSVETSIKIVNKGKSVLTAGESTIFTVYIDPTLKPKEDPEGMWLISPAYEVENSNIKEWKVFGRGSISNTHTVDATYKAPASITASSVDVVEATVVKILNRVDPTQYGTAGTLIIRTNIQLDQDEYFYWSVKGAKFSGGVTTAQGGNGRTALSVSSGTNSLSIQINGQRTGSFSPGNMEDDGKLAVVASLNGKIYQTQYTKCGSNEKQYGQGSLNITKYGEAGGYIEGTLSVGTYQVDGCNVENGMVLASFRLKRRV